MKLVLHTEHNHHNGADSCFSLFQSDSASFNKSCSLKILCGGFILVISRPDRLRNIRSPANYLKSMVFTLKYVLKMKTATFWHVPSDKTLPESLTKGTFLWEDPD